MTQRAPGQPSSLETDEDKPPKKPMGPNFHWNGSSKEPAPEDSPSHSDDDDGPLGSPGAKPSVPMQKRRRVTRACDECRRKKIKCDGRQPCTHCTVYSYDCTFDQPSNRRRNPAPQYIEAIENRLHRAEALLKTVLPNVNLNDPNVMAAVPSGGPNFPQPGYEKNAGIAPNQQKMTNGASTEAEKDSMLESMVQSTGSLKMDDKGHWDFYGHSSGLVFLNRLRQQFGDSNSETDDRNMAAYPNSRHLSQVLDSPRSADSPMDTGLPNTLDLPSQACARQLCEVAIKDAFALMRFVHFSTFFTMFDRIYDTPPDQWGNDENQYLPLVYAVLSVGSIFAKAGDSKLQHEGYDAAIESGFKYFKASRQMMDITDCRDLPSLQAVLCMVLFLQSSAKLVTCYSYIGIALHSAIRMGMHRNIQNNFNPIESEIRKRIFWQIRKMDIYVGALLGLPMMLSDDDIDQEEPLEVDDEYITAEKILPMPEGYVPLMCAMTAHTRLVRILRKVMIYIYPIKGTSQGSNKPQTYSVSHAKIREIEQDLQEWYDSLPDVLRPGATAAPEYTRVQQLLRIGYGHVQLFLYRPFLHYTSQQGNKGKIDKRSFACAAACVSVARNVVHITAEINKRGVLVGAYWFTMYTNFLAILSLVFFVFENLNSQSSVEILKDAQDGKNVLASLARRSMAADRCNQTLTGLFNQLEKFKQGRITNAARKRHASPGPRAMSAANENEFANAHSKQQASTQPSRIKTQQPQRASTFPANQSLSPWKRHSIPRPGNENFNTQSSSDIYTSPAESIGHRTPDSISSGSTGGMPNLSHSNVAFLQHSQPQQQALFPSTYTAAGLPDLGAMMFPSTDPFAYPNQPMTTLEANHQEHLNDSGSNGRPSVSSTIQQQQQQSQPANPNQTFFSTTTNLQTPRNPSLTNDGTNSDSSTLNSSSATTTTSNGLPSSSTGAEVQLFGPMPPYMMQGGQQAAGLMGGMDIGSPMGMSVGMGAGLGFSMGFGPGADEMGGLDVWDGMLDDGSVGSGGGGGMMKDEDTTAGGVDLTGWSAWGQGDFGGV